MAQTHSGIKTVKDSQRKAEKAQQTEPLALNSLSRGTATSGRHPNLGTALRRWPLYMNPQTRFRQIQ